MNCQEGLTAAPKYVEKSLRKEKSTTTNSHQGRHMGVVATTYVLIAKVHEVTDFIHHQRIQIASRKFISLFYIFYIKVGGKS